MNATEKAALMIFDTLNEKDALRFQVKVLQRKLKAAEFIAESLGRLKEISIYVRDEDYGNKTACEEIVDEALQAWRDANKEEV